MSDAPFCRECLELIDLSRSYIRVICNINDVEYCHIECDPKNGKECCFDD